jgi:hypothetical protein
MLSILSKPFPSIGSLDKLKFKEEIFTSIPNFPGCRGDNSLRTVPSKGWFTFQRFCSPIQPFFDQTWKPGDFEKIN